MPQANIRFVYDNAADRATVSASSTAGALVAANMQNDFKGQVHRSVGTSVTYNLTWATFQAVGCVALPAVNLSSTSQIRARYYSDTGMTTLLGDTGTVYACPGFALDLWDWSLPINANAFAFGGASKTALWFTPASVKGVKIDITDPDNTAGYIDCARLVVGNYWEPTRNPDYGAKVAVMDTTKSERNDSGDLLPDLGVKYDRMLIDLKLLGEADRAMLMRLARGPGSARNILASIYPDNAMSVLEQDNMVYGKFNASEVAADFFSQFSRNLTMEGW